MTNTFRTPDAHLDDPGQIIANLPGLLGFYPEDSVILVALEKTEKSGHYLLGPVLRLDLEDMSLVPRALASLDDYYADFPAVLCFIVSQRESDEVMLFGRDVSLLAASYDIEVKGMWWADQILSGEPYHCIVRPSASTWPLPQPLYVGTIAPVTQAVSLGALVEHGELPEMSREDALQHVSRDNRHITEGEAKQLAKFARRYAIELVTRITEQSCLKGAFHRGPWNRVEGISEDMGYLLTEIEQQDLSVEELMEQEDVLLSAAVFLSSTLLRDIIVEDLVAQPGPAARLMLAVARTFGGTIRANALSGYAVAYLKQGLPMRALPALLRAVEEFPEHELSELLLTNCQRGLFDYVIDRVRQGSCRVRTRYGVTDPGIASAAA